MNRLIRTALGAMVMLLALAPAALAAGPGDTGGRGQSRSIDGLIVSIGEDVVLAEGEHADALVVLGGDAVVRGTVDGLVIVDGTATLESATVSRIFVANGTVNADAGTVVGRAISEVRGSIYAEPGARLPGIRDVEADAALIAMALAPVAILLGIGAIVLVYAVALLVAGLGARQARGAGALMAAEPWKALAAGLVVSVVLPVVAGALILTVVGAPIGIALLVPGIPLLAFAGWLVAAIWLGEVALARLGGSAAPATRHPFRAALLGVTVLSLAGIVPLVSGIATMFGTGALVLAAFRGSRSERSPEGSAPAGSVPGSPVGDGAGDGAGAGTGSSGQGPLWGPATSAAS